MYCIFMILAYRVQANSFVTGPVSRPILLACGIEMMIGKGRDRVRNSRYEKIH